MKVALTVDAIVSPLTGIGRYALELGRGLKASSEIEDCRFFAAFRFVAEPGHALRANRMVARARHIVPFKSFSLRSYFALRNLVFRAHQRALQGYLLHCPNYLLLEHDGPAVTTVHDLSWLHYPEFHPRERVELLNARLPNSLRRAQRVITDSEHVRNEVIDRYALPPEKVRTVPLGVNSEYRPRERDAVRATLEMHGLADCPPYLLSVATREPRKNLSALTRAYASLPAALRSRYPLVVVGTEGWGSDVLLKEQAALIRSGTIRVLGYVDESALPALYAGAHAFAITSLYEGFGLPLLEALASGVPALSSKRSSLPEVAGDAALYVDVRDDAQLAAGLTRLLLDDEWRRSARFRGLERAREFSWGRCVAETIAVYREASTA